MIAIPFIRIPDLGNLERPDSEGRRKSSLEKNAHKHMYIFCE